MPTGRCPLPYPLGEWGSSYPLLLHLTRYLVSEPPHFCVPLVSLTVTTVYLHPLRVSRENVEKWEKVLGEVGVEAGEEEGLDTPHTPEFHTLFSHSPVA